MAATNLERMIEIIDGVFSTRNDPDQLQVTEEDIARLQLLHPATLSEYNEGHGPCIWVLLIPTTKTIMQEFLEGKITETALLYNTPPGIAYEAIYLCSVTTLPEYRGKGLTTKLTLEAINAIRSENPITDLFVWPFTKEGEILAQKIAVQLQMPLHLRAH